jgi:ATP-dependent helicase/nuclease subunit A
VPAESEADIPEAYLWQMALTRAALQRLYPGKTITCGLLWTVGPNYMPLTSERLDASLP